MALALILSSFVAASRIGGAAQQYVLAAHRIDPVLAPTAMFGRSPAKGAVGVATDPAVFRRMLGDIEADAVFGMLDLIITGHFSLPEQVEIAAAMIERVRASGGRQPIVVVDPILGDAPKGLYVKPEVAELVQSLLIPLADWITPNTWELSRISGLPTDTAPQVVAAVRSLGKKALVTSCPAPDGEIGIILVDGDRPTVFSHPRIDPAPNGTGDLVTASFGAGLVEGLSPLQAAERAARAAAETVEAAQSWPTEELPIVAMADRLVRPTAAVRIEQV